MNYCNECGKKVSTGKIRCTPCQVIHRMNLNRKKAKNRYKHRFHVRITEKQYRFLQTKGTMTEYIRKLIDIAMG